MTRSRFLDLLKRVSPFLRTPDDPRRKPIPKWTKLVVTASYLASGATQQTLAFGWRIGKSTVCNIIGEVCSALYDSLQPEFLAFPDSNQWITIRNDFWNFPNCVGAIDGKNVAIQKPSLPGSKFFNYKHFCSIVLMAISDATYCFTYIDVGSYGRANDGGIFSSSSLGKQLQDGSLDLPVDSALPLSDYVTPCVFLGYQAFPLLSNLMWPYQYLSTDKAELIFNYRLSRARRIIENAFGILSARWRIFQTRIIAKPEKVDSIIKAACCLHNFLRKMDFGDGNTY